MHQALISRQKHIAFAACVTALSCGMAFLHAFSLPHYSRIANSLGYAQRDRRTPYAVRRTPYAVRRTPYAYDRRTPYAVRRKRDRRTPYAVRATAVRRTAAVRRTPCRPRALSQVRRTLVQGCKILLALHSNVRVLCKGLACFRQVLGRVHSRGVSWAEPVDNSACVAEGKRSHGCDHRANLLQTSTHTLEARIRPEG